VLHKEIPFLRIGLPLCAGIVSGLYIRPGFTSLAIASLIISIGFILSLIFNRNQTNILYGFTLNLAFYMCGLVLFTYEKSSLSSFKPEKTIFTGTLSDYPEEKENSFMMTVKLNSMMEEKKSVSVKGSILLYHEKDNSLSSFKPGDILIFSCSPSEIVNRSNPYEFNYRFFMESQGVRYFAFTKRSDIINHIIPLHRKIIHRALMTRERIISMFRERGIKGERLALVAAITLGQKRMLDRDQKLNFMKAGVMHIMAVSGLHAIILSLFVFNVLFFMKGRFNVLRVIITIAILWSFAFVTGLTASVLRATLMYSFLQSGKLMKRPVNNINSVLASAFVLVIMRPSVIFDAGFLLSYSAVIYIITFYQGFYTLLLFKSWIADKIWQSAIVTIVAQAGTLPLTIMLFNRFPTYFILANVTIVPVSNLLIVTGCLIPVFFQIKLISSFLAIILNFLTGLTESLTAQAAALPYSSLENIGMTTPECILLAITIFIFSKWILNRKSFSFLYPLLFLTLFVASATIKRIAVSKTNEIIVYNIPGSTSVAVRTGRTLNLFFDGSQVKPEVYRHCATLGLKLKKNVLKNDYCCLNAGNKKILLTCVLDGKVIQAFNPDLIILTGLKPVVEKNLSITGNTEVLIIASGAGPGYRFNQQALLSGVDSVHFVRKSGAFIKRF
jgi:competence protein ComEC